MHVFIDESGSFSGVEREETNISSVGALVMPDERMPQIYKKYEKIRKLLPKKDGEVKGRLLNETQLTSVVDILRRNECIFEVDAVDLGIHKHEQITAHKKSQEEEITRHLTAQHYESVREDIWALRARLETMPLQLYIQSVLTFNLIYRTICNGTLFYCQRSPKDLGSFSWIIDAKDKSRITEWEDWWSFCILPALESRSFREPMPEFDEGDYSYFRRFDTDPSEYKKSLLRVQNSPATDIKTLITERFRFSSDAEYGLELVDILVNSIRRALVGNLQPRGYLAIKEIMIDRQNQCINLTSLGDVAVDIDTLPYRKVLKDFMSGGRDMLAPKFRE